MTTNEDIAVVQRVLDGDVGAFRQIVERYQRPVFCAVANLVPCNHECEDICQDVFLAAFENLSLFDAGKSQFSSWLFTIARNKSLNVLRKRKPLLDAEVSDLLEVNGPEENLAGQELFKQLDMALEALSPTLQTVFVMAEFVGLSHAQIAEIEEVENATIRSRLSRAKSQLRDLMESYLERERP